MSEIRAMTKGAVCIRAADRQDGPAVAQILEEAFPSLYLATFGKMRAAQVIAVLTELYRHEVLSLEATRIAEREGEVVGIAILHTGKSIGRGHPGLYWKALRKHLSWWRAARAFAGGLCANAMIGRRIPRAPDLVYIEALAVREEARRRGVGTLLLADAEAWACAHGRPRLALHVLCRNVGARQLYERAGFRLWVSGSPAPAETCASGSDLPLSGIGAPASRRRDSAWASLLLVRSLECGERSPLRR